LSKFNKIYEFEYEIDGQMCDMKMTSVSGHLLNHDFEERYRKWYSCPPAQLFDLPVHKSCRDESGLKIKKTLEREARGAKWLIIWTDCDREGENIGFEVIDVCQVVMGSNKGLNNSNNFVKVNIS
jgi:DNA topoisomerase-3